ncbi:recombinase family protein [Cellulomonas flavigena]|uniref:recombinase family protein n=1 Tax=Cellulomonas flavigena TaxID=1711 RepID=UPI00019E2F97|nr:recombinase family protein [Cellulomonas flavigena]
MTTRRAVALYARISQDRSGDEAGVTRQLKDCRAEAERRGWTVAEEYVDDDVSAYSGKRRPAYERMLRDITEGRRDAVVVWHMDRLHRRPIELEQFVAVCDKAGVRDLVTLSGEVDLTNGDGLLLARFMSAVAAHESSTKPRRLKRKALEIAETGRPTMGGRRPFGFAEDRITHESSEAAAVREVAARLLAGESLTSVTTWMQESGVPTVSGAPWRTHSVRQVVTNPRMWGMRVHQDQVIGEGTWEPILTPEQGERLQRLLLDPARRTNRTARRYLLSGMLTCGKCGARMVSAPREGVRRYACRTGPDQRGCGGIYVVADPLERLVAEAVLQRLDSPQMHDALTGNEHDDAEVAALAAKVQDDERRLLDLADMFASGEIERVGMKRAREQITPRLEANRRALAAANGRDQVVEYAGRGAELREAWDGLDLSRQVAVVKAVLAGATVLPATQRGRRGFDPGRVVPDWRA